MNKQKLVEIMQKVLKTDTDLSFLFQLEEREIETLIAIVRDCVDNNKK